MREILTGLLKRENGTTGQSRIFEHGAGNSLGLWQRMAMDALLIGHRGCVNHVEFDEQGTFLASGSDDTRLCLWDLQSSKPLTVHTTGHSQNIFCVRFMPASSGSQPVMATCAGDGEVRLHDLATGAKSVYDHHTSRVKKLVTEPGNPHLIISCSEDGTVRQIDVRQPARNATQLLQLARNGVKLEINSISAPWHKPWLLAVGASDDFLRVYDRRTTGTTAGSRPRTTGPKCVTHFSPLDNLSDSRDHTFSSDCITGVQFAADGTQLLANYLGDHVYLWSMNSNSSRGSKLAMASAHTAGAADVERQAKRMRQDDSAAAAVERKQGVLHSGKPSDGRQPAASAATRDENMQPETVEQAATAAPSGPDAPLQDTSAASAGGGGRVLTADTAVELIERGELHVRRRLGSLARMILNRSQDLYERGEVEASLRYSTAALQLQPALGMAHYQSAICHHQLGNTAAALAAGEAALQYAWNYDLDRFVRRLRREVQNTAAAEEEGYQGDGSRDVAEEQQQQQQQQHQQQQQQQEGDVTAVHPLPAALVQRLQARGIMQGPAAAAAAAACDDGNADKHRHGAAGELPAVSAAVAAEGNNGGGLTTAAGAATLDLVDDDHHADQGDDGDGDVLFAGIGEAADGGSESWEPPSDGSSSSSSSSSDEGDFNSSSSGDGSGQSEGSDDLATSETSYDDSDLFQVGSFGLLASCSDQTDTSGSSSDGSSGANGTSSSSGSYPSEDSDLESGLAVPFSETYSSSDEDEDSEEEDVMDDILGLDLRHRYYDWGGQDAAASSSHSLQQQAGYRGPSSASNIAAAHRAAADDDDHDDHDDGRQHFRELLEPLRHQLLTLQTRQQQRIREQQRVQESLDRLTAVLQQPQLQQQRLQQLHDLEEFARDRLGYERQEQQQGPVMTGLYQTAAAMLLEEEQAGEQQQQAREADHAAISYGKIKALLLLPLGEQYCPEGYQQQQWEQQQREVLAGMVELLMPDDSTAQCLAFANRRAGFALRMQRLALQPPQQQQQQVEQAPLDARVQQQLHEIIERQSDDLQVFFTRYLKQLKAWQQQSLSAALGSVPAAAAAHSDEEDDDEDVDDEDDSQPLGVDDLLEERDPLILQLGTALAAGEYGHNSASSSESGPSAAAAGACENGRIGAVVPDSTTTPSSVAVTGGAAAAVGDHTTPAGRCHRWSCRYRGHLNSKTIKDVSFVGPSETMVAAGSDDGRLFVWDRYTGALVTALRADRFVVNCIASHPNLPLMASCGIDNTVKLWTPCLNQPRPIDRRMLFCLGYNEIERAADSSMRCTGFGGLCKAFSKQNVAKMVQQIRQQQHAAAAGN